MAPSRTGRTGRTGRWGAALVGVTALVATALTACDGPRPDAAATGGPGTAAPSATACLPPDGTAPGTAGPAPDGLPAPVPFGQPRSMAGAGFDVEFIVFDYKQPVGPACPAPDLPDHEWSAVDVRICAKVLPAGFEYGVAWAPWSVAFAAGTMEPTSAYERPRIEEPRLPDGEVLPAGQCVRGWVTLPVPKGKRPVMVIYRPVGHLYTWTVPPPS